MLLEITDLALGCKTTPTMQKYDIPIEFDQFCFSIITNQRTLDLRANEIEIKAKWVNYLRAFILQRREAECKKASRNLKRVENEEKRE
jgi:cytohesin/brefeldin A-inhibited guanine nucleotide-exchange protein